MPISFFFLAFALHSLNFKYSTIFSGLSPRSSPLQQNCCDWKYSLHSLLGWRWRCSLIQMSAGENKMLTLTETTCGTLLNELQIIWEEVGESDIEKDRMLLELERECLEVYRRKVDQANKCRAQLRQAIADAEAELAAICSSIGEPPVHIRQSDQSTGSLKVELRAILPQIEEMRKRKSDRKTQFIEVNGEIQSIKNEIYGGGYALKDVSVNETDLSLRKLEELHIELQELQNEKCERLKHVHEHLNYLYLGCSVLGLDFKQTVSEIHPSLGEPEGSKDISNGTIEQLRTAIQRMQEVKIQRMQQLRDLASSLLELWNLMDTPIEEQQIFQKVTCNIAASEDEITEPGMLSADFINYVKAEVSRLEELKVSKMKELVLKKRGELEDICRKTHLIPDSDNPVDLAIEAVESGAIDASCVLEQIELQISKVREEALNRKDILERVQKWMAACDEESWLEEYNRDDNRYSAVRGAHLILKRAEKARVLVNKLPAMVETLASKITAWEKENGVYFTYDGVRLLYMLEDYMTLRQEKELERKRQRDQKKLHGQLLTEQEALYGSKPSPMKNQSAKKGARLSCGGAATSRRLSLGGNMLQTPRHDMPPPAKATPVTRNAKKSERVINDSLKGNGFQTLSTGRRGLDLAGLPASQHSLNLLNGREIESSMTRKPFSPISSTDSSRSNATNILGDLKQKHNDMMPKMLTSNNSTPFSTPSKMISAAEVENRMPQVMATPVPSTPSTLSIPMHLALTPMQNPLPSSTLQMAITPAKSVNEEIEYSFEEKRARFVLPRSHLVNLMQVL
ncbi:65-kDa microtubule-associated protein 3-like isoform X1 [Salvia splendens]|uniref:65-kDa microtubule-associated protein 3-like isoform X1 n=1 Tax=Salvia splendens TaxID=180675 RepID=UPI001C25EEEE|nr:65-kDa microtubule-associated protein 3-like isoform X1 [Salvia splendens]